MLICECRSQTVGCMVLDVMVVQMGSVPSGRGSLKYFAMLLQEEEVRSLSMATDVTLLLNFLLLFRVLSTPDLL